MGVGPSDFQRRVEQPPKCVEPIGSGKSGALVGTWEDGMRAVIKLAKDELPNGKKAQRGIRVCDHPKREKAYSTLADIFGWGYLVPKVALFSYEGQEASAQAFITADQLVSFCDKLKDRSQPDWDVSLRKTCALAPKNDWLKIVVLDLVAGARDRHINNVGLRILFDTDMAKYRPIAWDNSVSFGETFHFYHEVFHKFLFRKKLNLAPVWDTLVALRRCDLDSELKSLLPNPVSIEHAWKRLQFLIEYPYRLPWKVMSKGSDSAGQFPDYKEHFSQEPLEPPVQRGEMRYATPVAT